MWRHRPLQPPPKTPGGSLGRHELCGFGAPLVGLIKHHPQRPKQKNVRRTVNRAHPAQSVMYVAAKAVRYPPLLPPRKFNGEFEVGVPRAVGHSMRGSCLDASVSFIARNVIAGGALEGPWDLDGFSRGTAGLASGTSAASPAAHPRSILAAYHAAPLGTATPTAPHSTQSTYGSFFDASALLACVSSPKTSALGSA